MKPVLYTNPRALFAIVCFSLLFTAACHEPVKIRPAKITKQADLDRANEHEFMMTRDPKTLTIPEGVFEGERAQAQAARDRQRLAGNDMLFTYAYQGPDNLGGRTRAVEYDVRFNGTTNRIILACGVSGGVYKSVDDGATWVRKSPTGEHFSCTSLAQDPRVGFQDTWYYSVGEATGNSANGSGAFYFGNGVYKSTDNGETWARLPASNTTPLETFSSGADAISKVVVNPINGHVFIAALASIRRSTDGGASWTIVLPGTLSSTGNVTDIVVTASGRLYAAFGGINADTVDGVWASPPGGAGGAGTWVRIAGAGAGGSPAGWNAEGAYGRVVLAIAPSDPRFLYALYFDAGSPPCPGATKEAKFFRWDDTLGTWTDLTGTLPDEPGCLAGNDPFAVQGGYDLVVAVKPDSASTLFIGGTNAYRSTDSGVTWTKIGGYATPASYASYVDSHADIHWFAFSPVSTSTMICGNDGGIQRTTDNLAGVVTWTPINTGYRTYQYYYVDVDPRMGNGKVIGGAQDNGTTRNIGGSGTAFESVFSGDGVSVGLSDLIAGIQYEYVGFQNGAILRRMSTDPDGAGTLITPAGAGGGLFVTLFKLDADNSELLYYASNNSLYRATTASTVGTTVAPAPPPVGETAWTSMTGISGAVTAARWITAIAPSRGAYSPATSSLFIGASDPAGGPTPPKVFRLDNPAIVAGGTAPTDITPPGFPAGAYVSSIAVHPTNDDIVMVTLSNYGVSSIWLTANANSGVPTWTEIEGNISLPSVRSSAISVRGATVDYFVGTSAGLFVTQTPAAGATVWSQEGSAQMGNAVVSSLALRPSDNKLLVGTHGYGMWSTSLATSAGVSVSGRVVTSEGTGIRNVILTLTDQQGGARTFRTGSMGYFHFENVTSGATYTLSAASKRYTIQPRVVTVNDNIENLTLMAE